MWGKKIIKKIKKIIFDFFYSLSSDLIWRGLSGLQTEDSV